MEKTSVQEKELKYEALVEATHTGYVILDSEGRVVDANREYVRMSGHKALADILSRKVSEWTAPHDLARNLEEVKKCLACGSVNNLEIDYVGANGRITPVEINATTLITNEGLRIITLCRDISERKRAERVLRESEKHKDNFFSLMPDLVFRLNADGHFVGYKAENESTLFMPPEQFLGKDFNEVLPPDVAMAFADSFKKAVQSGRIQKLEYALRRSSDRVEFYEARICPQLDREYIVLCRNITEQHKAQEALQGSEELARQRLAEIEVYYHTAPIGLCVVDTNMRYLRINERLARMNGRPVMAHIGHTIHDLIPDLADAAEALIRQVISNGEAIMNVEVQGMAPSLPGIVQVGLTHWYPLKNSEGRTVAVNVAIEDITERKNLENALRDSETRYRLLAENATDVIWTVDMQLNPIYISPSVTRLLGFSVEEAMGRSMQDAYTPESFALVMSVCREEMEKEQRGESDPARSQMLDLEMNCKDGSIATVEVNFSFLRDQEKRACGIMAIARSIAGRKKVEAQLRRANEELERRVEERTARLRKLAAESTLIEQRERRRLADIIHDDLQQLLVGAKLQLEVLSSVPDQEHQKQAADRIKIIMDEAIQKSRSLCDELGTPLLHGAEFKRSLRWLCQRMEELHGLDVHLTMETQLKTNAEDVKVLLFHSIRELLFNVIKHSGCRTASVHIGQQNFHTEIVVADTGTGFYLQPGQEMDIYGGGYGLFSIRERLGNIGGRMAVDSKPGSGTRITLIIPDTLN